MAQIRQNPIIDFRRKRSDTMGGSAGGGLASILSAIMKQKGREKQKKEILEDFESITEKAKAAGQTVKTVYKYDEKTGQMMPSYEISGVDPLKQIMIDEYKKQREQGGASGVSSVGGRGGAGGSQFIKEGPMPTDYESIMGAQPGEARGTRRNIPGAGETWSPVESDIDFESMMKPDAGKFMDIQQSALTGAPKFVTPTEKEKKFATLQELKRRKGGKLPKQYEAMLEEAKGIKKPFTEGSDQKVLGDLTRGFAKDAYGYPIKFENRKAAIDYITGERGPDWKKNMPEAAKIIEQKFPVTLPPNVKKLSQAMQHLQNVEGMTEEESKEWLKKRM